MLFAHLFLLFILSYVLGRAAGFVGQSLHRLGRHFRSNDFLMAFLILAAATSAPEITVALNSAWRGVPELSLGNLLGASIVVLSLLVGLASILAGRLSIQKFFRGGDFLIYLALTVLPVVAVADGYLSRLDGVMLIAAYLYFLLHFHQQKERYPEHFKRSRKEKAHLGQEAWILFLSLVVLLAASYFLVNSALFVARALNVAPLLIGLLVLSIGTNLPEFALVLTQSRRGQKEIALGDLLGNVLLNTPTLGLLALFAPFAVSQTAVVFASAVFLLVVAALFGLFMWSKNVLSRQEGLVLLVVYALFAANHLGLF